MRKIAVTGGIACGKSVVGKFMTQRDVPVLDTDDVVHELVLKDTKVYRNIVNYFGQEIIDQSGEINRRELGNIVFSDPEKLARLNSITHPEVEACWKRWLGEINDAENRPMAAAVIIPLLFEGGFDIGWNSIICVAAPLKDQVSRMNALGIENVMNRISAQMPLREKMRRSDYVVFNGGSLDFLEQQIERVLMKVMEK